MSERARTKNTKLAKELETTAGQLLDAVNEGSGRFRGDRAYFYECAYASGAELAGKFDKAELLRVLSGKELAEPRQTLDREMGLLWGLIKAKK